MDGELLDVITPIRDKIGMENILTVALTDRLKTLKFIVKRMGDMEELIGSASVPLNVFASLHATDFQRIWVKLSVEVDGDLFIPTPAEEVERPRVLVAFRTRGLLPPKKTPSAVEPETVESADYFRSAEHLQQRVWELEAELEVTKTELKYEQEKDRQHNGESLKRAEDRIRELEAQLKSAVECAPRTLSPKPEPQKYSELLAQYRTFVESQKAKEQATDVRIAELLQENATLKGDLAAKQHHVSTLVSEVTFLKQSLILQQAESTAEPQKSADTSELSEMTDEIAELQLRLTALQSENSKLRKDMESFTQPKAELARTPKNDAKVPSPKKLPSDPVEVSLNALLPKFGFSKVSRVVEGIYLLGSRRIHAKVQGSTLIAQLGGSADWLPAEELLSRLKEEGEAKSLRRSISVGQESEMKASPDGQPTPKKARRDEEDSKARAQATSKIMRDFSPILKKKK